MDFSPYIDDLEKKAAEAIKAERRFCVYKHTSPSGKVYIGITGQNPITRWQGGNGYKKHPYFFKAILKYGWDNIKHEILFDSLTKEEACQKEIELISKYKSNIPQFGYNKSSGGECAASGVVFTTERLCKMSEAHKGKRLSEETRQKLSEALKGENAFWYGKHHSIETRKKLSQTHKGKPALNKKKVLCVETGNIYESVTTAAKEIGVSLSLIVVVCKGKQKTAGGYHWKYIKEETE